MKVKFAASLFLLAAVGIAFAYNLQEKKMFELKFYLGENIVDTARKSGAPRFGVDDVAGLISYELSGIPADIAITFATEGYEISVKDVYSLVMYADDHRRDNMAVQALMLQFSTDSVKSHEDGKKFMMQIANKFRNGKWKRYIRADCPSVTGRSAYLNEAGQLAVFGACPLDPNYTIPLDDWVKLTDQTQTFQWMGNGTLATLSVRYSDDTRGITYSVDLDFENFAIKQKVEQDNLDRELAVGDKKGWNSTASYKKQIQENKVKIKMLEASAMHRGDHLLSR